MSDMERADTSTEPDHSSDDSGRLPLVSVVLPMRNEAGFIEPCLDSILANDYPHDRLEVMIVDGMSDDGSRDRVAAYTEQYPSVRLLDNPQRIVPTAMNVGIRHARGEIVVRMDAHTLYAEDYIRRSVEALQATDAANVGGAQRAVGAGYLSNAIAVATTHPFGIGDAKFRYSDEAAWVDTVYLGAWHRDTLEQLGGFNEDWIVNQDYELNYRLRERGGKILLSPKIRCWYYVRPSLAKLIRQYFRYGKWKVKTLTAYPASLRWRQLVPPAFVAAFGLSLILLAFGWTIGALMPAVYLIAVILASAHASSQGGWQYFPLLPLVFATLHVSWGLGFFAGLARFGIPKLSWRSLRQAFR